MDIISKPLASFSFDNIVAFAKENNQEGVQLDYKEELPDKKKLSQLVAAFANTRGGVIVVGVKENRENGRPAKWEGIRDDHHDEFVAQVIGNISPLPSYEFHKTDDKDGKVFVLIRVFEGNQTPYYPHNDSNIWIRTGSIKKSVEIASPEHAELLFKKTDRAENGRHQNIILANKNYEAFLQSAENERKHELAVEKHNYEIKKSNLEDGDTLPPFSSPLSQFQVGNNVAMLTITIQPFFSHGQIIRPLDIEPVIQRSEVRNNHFSFPIRAGHWDSVKEGMIHFNWRRHNGEVGCQQVFANGLMYSANDVLRVVEGERKVTYLSWFVSQLYITLRGSRKILSELGYQGTLVGKIHISGIQGVAVIPVIKTMFFDDGDLSKFDKLSWPINVNTKLVTDEPNLREYIVQIAKDIHWSFGYKDIQKGITVERLEKDRFFVS